MQRMQERLRDLDPKAVFTRVIDAIFAVMLLFITLTLVIATVRLFFRLGDLFEAGGITGSYLYIFSDVLTLFILVELSQSLFSRFTDHGRALPYLLDAAIAFVIRHLMIGMFEHKVATGELYAFAALLLALGAVRFGAQLSDRRAASPPGDPPGGPAPRG